MVMFLPGVGNPGLDTLVGVKFNIANHNTMFMDAVRHSLLLLFVGLKHFGVNVDPEEPADALDTPAGMGHQVLEGETVVPMGRDIL